MSIKQEVKTENKSAKPKLDLKYLRARDAEPVRGIFRFHEVPGGLMSFNYGRVYEKDEPIETYNMIDGEIYTVPLGVARHLNKNCWYPVHSYLKDETGHHTQKIGQKVRRCSFQSLEFVDTADLTPVGGSGIISVENI